MPDQAAPDPDHTATVTGRRGAARLRLSIPARIVSIHGTHDCIVLDLSRTGARIALAEPIKLGAGGVLRVAQLEVFGEVVHRAQGSRGGINGLAFEAPLSNDAVLAVRHYSESFEAAGRIAFREQVRKWVTGEKS